MKSFEIPEKALALTEQRNPLSEDIDVKSSLEIVEIINREDRSVASAVFEARASIATAVDWVAQGFTQGGRLIYVGAGTSGRLGQLDAAECPPTFGVSPDRVLALVAGGKKALIRAVEGAEDDAEAGARELLALKPSEKDVVLGISSGSTTPYVRGALKAARVAGSKTVFLTCTPLPEKPEFADLVLSILTGPEILTGSTRMKAGTATKMVLNMISTGAMIRAGKTYGNLMVDLSCSNRKLVHRGARIIQSVTLLSKDKARRLLTKANKNVKVALAMSVMGADRAEAEKLLKEQQGFLRRLFERPHRKNPKLSAIFFDMDGTILQYALPTGFSTWAALGWAFKMYDHMEEWVDQYLNQKIHYDDIWRFCAGELNGKSFDEIRDVLFPCSGMPPLSRGFVDCIKVLREHYQTGIVTSGISIVSQEVVKTLGLDFEVSNHLGMKQGRFDGTFSIGVPFDQKLASVEKQAKSMGLKLSEICFVGDSPNDIATLRSVGFPVAYNPKAESVVQATKGKVIGDFLQLPRMLEEW